MDCLISCYELSSGLAAMNYLLGWYSTYGLLAAFFLQLRMSPSLRVRMCLLAPFRAFCAHLFLFAFPPFVSSLWTVLRLPIFGYLSSGVSSQSSRRVIVCYPLHSMASSHNGAFVRC